MTQVFRSKDRCATKLRSNLVYIASSSYTVRPLSQKKGINYFLLNIPAQ